jgi:hypothetical protein
MIAMGLLKLTLRHGSLSFRCIQYKPPELLRTSKYTLHFYSTYSSVLLCETEVRFTSFRRAGLLDKIHLLLVQQDFNS